MITDFQPLFYDTNLVKETDFEDENDPPDQDILCLYEENIARMFSIE